MSLPQPQPQLKQNIPLQTGVGCINPLSEGGSGAYCAQNNFQPSLQSPPPYQECFVPLQPINHQPQFSNNQSSLGQQVGWMAIPQGVQACPPGLEYLAMIDQLLVHQQIEILEMITGFETCNKYIVKNSLGQNVYWATEVSDCCSRQCCGPTRPFDMEIKDAYGNEVIHLNRPLNCQSCCCPCCLQTMDVFSPPGTLVGRIEQNWSILKPDFSIKNVSGDTILKIKGPFCTSSCFGDVEFKVNNLDDEQVEKISKQWSGWLKEVYTDADNFSVTFPIDLDIKIKAVVLAACFLIDMMYFESKPDKNN